MSSSPLRLSALFRASWLNAGGGICLAAMLVLWSPGVQVAGAEEAPVRHPVSQPLAPGALGGFSSEAESCEAGAPKGADLAAQVADVMAALEAKAEADGEDVVVFNGAGSNYGNDNDVLAEIRRVRAEVKRAQAAP
ncbi:MAG: hypothetical protein JRH01_09730 [Deltaproteobacteria bacterium]|nr:hypothetical protein [Deltaproteobacteria bacterium]MBW2395741.1 hypothetical protein [Deltaproteobacteria bacterium]